MSRRIRWFSCGAASAVATMLDIREHGADAGPVVYIEVGAEHPDNERFLADCERWFGMPITRIRSDEYEDPFAVWLDRRYMSGPGGAPCTGALKFAPRLDFQLPSDTHIWGYTADERKRADRMREVYPELKQATPLIDRELRKANVLALVEAAGIELPEMYKLGFHNNNCIGCVKSTSPAYWALVRKHFPREFYRIAGLSRELGCRLVIVRREKDENGKTRNIRGFIDEIPRDQPTNDPIAPACDFLCHFAEQDMAA
ncbi:hypothetical protein ACQR50_10310 [Sphingomonas sp. Xoc002]|uniref:hypothetical protein n=1 Tax=Sphingomonas sp. Xoc002 TaxID=2837624 RepID=UPI003D165462